MSDSLVERIYEAAFIPEYWPGVLGQLTETFSSDSSAMLVVDRRLPPLWAATPNVEHLLGAYAQTPGWYQNDRLRRMLRLDYAGFLCVDDFSTDQELSADSCEAFLSKAALSGQVGSAVTMPSGEVVLFTLERRVDMDPFERDDLAQMDAIRPHLARASLMAARLQMQQAEATVAALTAIGLPAAVLSSNGVVLAVNALFESDAAFLKPAAFGRLVVANREANALLQTMLPGQLATPEIRSLPVRPQEPDGQAAVIHVIPLERAAQDIFASGSALVVVTTLSREGMVPDDGLLKGLFDLSAAEAKLATGLAGGRSLQDLATARSISMATARSQLAQIFRKTGTGQQSELVALLKSAPSVPLRDGRKRDPTSD